MNASNSIVVSSSKTMSSREIAELVEKRHDNVKRTIETLVERGVIDHPQIEEYPDSLGRPAKEFRIGKRDSFVVVAQLSPEFTARLVDRWQELESGAVTAQLLPREVSVRILKAECDAAAVLGVPLHFAQIEAVKLVRAETGVDYAPLLALAPAQNNIQPSEELLEPTELGRMLGIRAVEVNRLLSAIGYQEKVGGQWSPTDTGKSFAVKHAWAKGTKSGYNLKWSVAIVDILKEKV